MLTFDDCSLLGPLFLSFYCICANVTFLLKFNFAISHFSTQALFTTNTVSIVNIILPQIASIVFKRCLLFTTYIGLVMITYHRN